MNKHILLIAAATASVFNLTASRFGKGFGVGALTGLASGFITSKIAENNRPPAVYVVEDSYLENRRAELEYKEQQHIREKVREKAREKELRKKQLIYQRQREQEQKAAKHRKIKNNIIEQRKLELKEKELAHQKRQTELELIKEKKQLIKEQNRKIELERDLLREQNKKAELTLKERKFKLIKHNISTKK